MQSEKTTEKNILKQQFIVTSPEELSNRCVNARPMNMGEKA